MVGSLQLSPGAHDIEDAGFEVFHGQVWKNAIFSIAGLAFSDKQVEDLLGTSQLKVTILIPVVVDSFVGMGLHAFRNIAIDHILPVDFYRLELNMAGGVDELGVVQVFRQGIELGLQGFFTHTLNASIIVSAENNMSAPAVQECADTREDAAGKRILRSLQFDFRPLAPFEERS